RELPGGKKLQGLLVRALLPNGAAEKAGLRGPKVVKERFNWRGMQGVQSRVDPNAADIIVGIDGQSTKKVDDFTGIVDDHKPGDTLVLDVYREEKTVKMPVTLE
ncbi:MAG: PDZ domain-containing protein, partial [Planctomycetaceae bacterium]|nr:PDZ domain-containing protein [Planctomycetaceae bacterium]